MLIFEEKSPVYYYRKPDSMNICLTKITQRYRLQRGSQHP